jgi:sucrose synthase
LPGLYQVTNGIDLFAPKFNVIPPGVDENLYFPYHLKEKRIPAKTEVLEKRLFEEESSEIYGKLANPRKIPIFTLARLDRIKNITGLIEAFGRSRKLRKRCNLVFSAGTIHFEQSRDAEEQDQIRIIYRLIEQYDLYPHIRWLPTLNRLETGEVYRIIADHQGIFVQPALFEAFGLTILEGMISGLPTFGPKFGGPSEIIEYGISGFLLNTSKPDLIAQGLEKFFERCDQTPDYWDTISKNGIKRVQEKYNWESYSQRLVELTKLYGFWRFSVSAEGKIKMNRYSDLIFHFLFKNRAVF